MSEPLSKIPGGMRYYFGAEARLRRTVEDTAMAVFNGWSYEEITTPTVDYYALFEHGMGPREAHRAFRFTDTDGLMLALRPDVTSSVARAAATLFAERQRPLRLCYAATIFRRQSQSHAQWRREQAQTGCELIGAEEGVADMEMLAIACEVLQRLGLDGKYSITLNNVEIFNGIAERLSLASDLRDEMRQLMDTRNGADLERFLIPYTSVEERRAFARLTQLSGKRPTLDEALPVITNPRSRAALDRIERLWRVIESLDLTDHFEIDLGDVSGLDYYTGLTFKIYVSGAGARCGSGGRYDRLTSNFGKAEPAIGFVLDIDALTDVLMTRERETAFTSTPEQTASSISNDDQTALFVEALDRRARGARVLINSSEVRL
ncbi:MAG TPA: ATP phosphoribosyltransferase regulatory subunit [Pyrinomonadaceae bacterium]|jgi:ATP phosphoribosyltransferase regulatory subunit